MKHDAKITILLIVMFFIAMLIGLLVINSYDMRFGKKAKQLEEKAREKNITIEKPELSIVREVVPEQIELKKTIDVVSVIISIVIAFVLAFLIFILLSKIKITLLLKGWFSVIVFLCLVVSFTLLFNYVFQYNLFSLFGKKVSLSEIISIPIAFLLTFLKIKKKNLFAHNLSELFIYPGIAVIFIPILNLTAAAVILIIISIYDMIAVWKTKHMQAMAKFQINYLKIFSGFFLPYVSKKDKAKIKKIREQLKKIKSKKKKEAFLKKQKVKINLAILGGGDIAFPMIFIGTVFLKYGLASALLVIFTTTLSLAFLLLTAKKGKFYPAMPFLTTGCFIGLALLLL